MLVIDAIAEAGLMGTIASQGPRYFGFVTGGSIPDRCCDLAVHVASRLASHIAFAF